jgi:hypothetical protein
VVRFQIAKINRNLISRGKLPAAECRGRLFPDLRSPFCKSVDADAIAIGSEQLRILPSWFPHDDDRGSVAVGRKVRARRRCFIAIDRADNAVRDTFE